MAPMTTLFIPDYGLKTDDIKYLKMDSYIQGRGPNRLKYLDLEGRWILSGKSIPYISSAFHHLERLNDARTAFRDITEEPLNAIGLIGWTKSSAEVKVEKKPKPFVAPPVLVENEVPPSPREVMPHRSAGYGPAHVKRKLSIPDRSRSVSPSRAETTSPIPVWDKYAKYEKHRKDSMTRYGTRWGDAGYASSSPSPLPGEIINFEGNPPHRTPGLSPRPASRHREHDTDYDPSYLENRPTDELRVSTKDRNSALPYRTAGYGHAHEKRQYGLSPKSQGYSDYSSSSEQPSPNQNADQVLLMAFHEHRNSHHVIQPSSLRRSMRY